MKYKTFLLVLILSFIAVFWAQNASTQAPASGSGSQARTEHQQNMIEMHKQQMEAMKSDVEKMKASLAAMKANIASITDTNEMARWRNNVDLWQTMIDHMEQMQKHMESMGPGMMQGHGTMQDKVTIVDNDEYVKRFETSKATPGVALAK